MYRQGDDPRRLDWKLLARSNRAFVRLTDDRALVPTWIVADASASLAFPLQETDGRPTKWDLLRAVAIGLAAVAHAGADPVGLLVASGNGARLAPRTRRGTVREVSRALYETRCIGSAAMSPLLAPLSPNCRIVVLSDLLGDFDETLRTASHLIAAGAQVTCVQVVAVEELELPEGAFLAVDPDDANAAPRALHRGARAEYRRAFDEFRADAARRWRAAGAGYLEARTDASAARLVRHIVSGAAGEVHADVSVGATVVNPRSSAERRA
ncbi:MAG: DUF58 domain-containing protein [Phycisphaerae bacterium]|nr:DUF58 domain-containing protein [Gemmatimonadaceae bacterium]